MKILIGTVNYKTKVFTELWLETLMSSICCGDIIFSDFKIEDYKIVVINNSPEEDISYLKEQYPFINLINNEKNVGVAAAWNQIIKQGFDQSGNALYDYFVPANNDIYFTKEWFHCFCKGLEQNTDKSFGWISSFLNDYKEPDLTGVQETLQLEGRYWGGLRPEADDVDDVDQMKAVIKATYAVGGGIEVFAETLKMKYGNKLKQMHPKAPLFALSKECIKKVGLFDEYNSPVGLHEDADYCKRVELAGLKLGVVYGAYAHHFSMMSRTKGDLKKDNWWVEAREKAFQDKWGVSSKEMHKITNDIKFRLDIGSGERPTKEQNYHWYHIDIDPQFPDVEFLQDVTSNLPFDDGQIEEIYTSNVLEHVEWKSIYSTLNEWKRVLKLGGSIEIRVPNFRWLVERYLEGSWKLSLEEGIDFNIMHAIFGGDHPGYPHLHKVGLDFQNLSEALKFVGFSDIKNESDPGSWELRVTAKREF